MAMQQKNLEALLEQLQQAAGAAGAGGGIGAYATGEMPRGMSIRDMLEVDPNVVRAGRASARVKGPKSKGRVMGGMKEIVGTQPGTVDKLLKKLGTTRKEAGRLGKEAIGFALLQGILNTAMQGGEMMAQSSLEGAEMDAQAISLTPEAVKETALQPVTRAQRDYALQMLMQQMSGGRGGRTRLARGEVLT